MANKPLQQYYNTTNIDGEELRQRMESCESQNMEILELAREVKTIWRWKLIELYQQYKGQLLLDAVASRALSDLRAMGYLIETGEKVRGSRGAFNIIYEINPNPPIDPIKIPKKICVALRFVENQDGELELDLEGMSDEFISKLNHWDGIFTPQNNK
jgi:hypothetical protein